jgi:hypothetical protein
MKSKVTLTDADTDVIADGIAQVLNKVLPPLKARLAALEARPTVKYFGIHQPELVYEEGSLVTKGGSLWIATRSTAARPGGDDSGWRLVVKEGRAT